MRLGEEWVSALAVVLASILAVALFFPLVFGDSGGRSGGDKDEHQAPANDGAHQNGEANSAEQGSGEEEDTRPLLWFDEVSCAAGAHVAVAEPVPRVPHAAAPPCP